MSLLRIVKYPDPILRQKTSLVDPAEPGLADLIANMFETMYAARGVGLAANQVGLAKRLAVIDCSSGDEPSQRLILINPRIVETRDEIEEEEGCLSFPGLRGTTRRFLWARVQAVGLDGKSFEVAGDDLLGKALQHELDHLDGRLFIDRLGLTQKALLSGKLKAMREDAREDGMSNASKR